MGNSKSNQIKLEKDEILLYQFPRYKPLPSASPFAIKLETWIRINKLKYQNSFGLKFSSKGKIPWIMMNGKEYNDSQMIINHLSNHFGINMNEHLSETEQAIARACLKLTEESLFWCMALHRFSLDPHPEILGIKVLVFKYFARKMIKRAKKQGYGKHLKEEIYEIGRADLKSLSTILGSKKFFFGDKPCDLDPAVFGVLAQIVYTEKGPLHQYMHSDCQNLVKFVETMKELYWPDWNECLSKQ